MVLQGRRRGCLAAGWGCVFAVFLLAGSCARGQLRWEATELEVESRPGQTKADGWFRFLNAGPRPVTLFGLKDGCGCSTSNLVRRAYGPGERGDFTLGIETGGTPGNYVKFATLKTDDPYQPNVYLCVHVRVPEAIEWRPGSLQWRVGGPASEQVLGLTLAEGPVVIESMICEEPRRFSIRCAGEGRDRRIYVKPADTARPARGSIRVEVRIGDRMRRTYSAPVSIQP